MLNGYDVVYGDPPWRYGGTGGTKWSPASDYYETMSFKELSEWGKDVLVPLLAPNCVIFSWVVSPELDACIEAIKSWGFDYITVGFVWHKRRANVGHYTMSGCELCLVFKRLPQQYGLGGGIPYPHNRADGQKQFIEEKVREHSRKPDEARARIERIWPNANRLEIFARQESVGWTAMGKEAGKFNAQVVGDRTTDF